MNLDEVMANVAKAVDNARKNGMGDITTLQIAMMSDKGIVASVRSKRTAEFVIGIASMIDTALPNDANRKDIHALMQMIEYATIQVREKKWALQEKEEK